MYNQVAELGINKGFDHVMEQVAPLGQTKKNIGGLQSEVICLIQYYHHKFLQSAPLNCMNINFHPFTSHLRNQLQTW